MKCLLLRALVGLYQYTQQQSWNLDTKSTPIVVAQPLGSLALSPSSYRTDWEFNTKQIPLNFGRHKTFCAHGLYGHPAYRINGDNR